MAVNLEISKCVKAHVHSLCYCTSALLIMASLCALNCLAQGGGGNGGGNNGGGQGVQTPSVTVGANTGVIESYVLAARAVRACASEIREKMPPAAPSTVILFDQTQQNNLNMLAAFQVQNTLVATILDNAIKQDNALPTLPVDLETPANLAAGLTAALPVANSLMQSIVGLVSLFRTDVTLGGTTVNLSDEVLIDEVARALRPKTIMLRPSLYFSDILDPSSVASSGIVISLQDLYQRRQDVSVRIAKRQAEVANLTALLKKATTDEERSRIYSFLASRSDVLTSLQAAAQVFDSFMQTITSNPGSGNGNGTTPGTAQGGVGAGAGAGGGAGAAGGGGAGAAGGGGAGAAGGGGAGAAGGGAGAGNGGGTIGGAGAGAGQSSQGNQAIALANLVFAELLSKKMQIDGTGLLMLHIEQSGGGYLTKSNIWTFFGGAHIFNSGGTVTTFTLLLPRTGEVIASGSCQAYSGYINSKDVKSSLEE